jgi:zinc protease
MQKLPIEEYSLSNGLRVVLSASHNVPTAAVAVYYDVGSRNEQKGRSGFAHLFEHMMFEGSENVPKTMHMKFISSAGGSMNGTTSEERTNYFEAVPSHMLPLALWLEADRMRSLKITKENFENQRETVKEERRQGVDNQPYGEVWIKLRETAIKNWAYSHSVIGSMDDLNSAGVEDARAFFNTYYAPNNAVLGIAGSFDIIAAMKYVEEYFGDIPSSTPAEPVDINEPLHDKEDHVIIYDAKIAMPGVLFTYHVPRRCQPDYYPVQLLKQILFDGKSARLYKRMIEDEEAAIECFGYVENSRGPALFPMWFIARDADNNKVKDIFEEEIDRLLREGVREDELQRSKNAMKSDFVEKLESCLGKALTIAEFKLYDNNPSLINTELDRYLQVNIADIHLAAKKYLVPSNRTILDVIPDASKSGKEN